VKTQKAIGDDVALGSAAKQSKRNDRGDTGSMSPSMRELILSFGEPDADRTWDPEAFGRRSP
jgi:hypothetical protein